MSGIIQPNEIRAGLALGKVVGSRSSPAFIDRTGETGAKDGTVEQYNLVEFEPTETGAHIRDARMSFQISLQDLAARTGLSSVELSAIERGALVADEFWENKILEEIESICSSQFEPPRRRLSNQSDVK